MNKYGSDAPLRHGSIHGNGHHEYGRDQLKYYGHFHDGGHHAYGRDAAVPSCKYVLYIFMMTDIKNMIVHTVHILSTLASTSQHSCGSTEVIRTNEVYCKNKCIYTSVTPHNSSSVMHRLL
jgi:hypothetical protein